MLFIDLIMLMSLFHDKIVRKIYICGTGKNIGSIGETMHLKMGWLGELDGEE